MPDWFQDVLEFHQKLAPHVIRETPQIPPEPETPTTECVKMCRGLTYDTDYAFGFMLEEMQEIREAMIEQDLPAIADGLGDLIYVAIRAAIIYGIDLRPVFAEIHRANLSKVGGATRADNRILKPPGFVPPDIAGVLSRQGSLKATPDPSIPMGGRSRMSEAERAAMEGKA